MGHQLGVGGHLTRLRRTRVGPYRIEDARTLEQLAERFDVVPLAQAAQAAFPRRDLSADEARRLAHGGRLAPAADAANPGMQGSAASAVTAGSPGPTAAYAPDGTLIALLTEESGQARPLVVFAEG
jgi:tRNA pseudouridine55 synthase